VGLNSVTTRNNNAAGHGRMHCMYPAMPSTIDQLVQSVVRLRYRDEDGAICVGRKRDPLSAGDISRMAARFGQCLPLELKRLLELSNGVSLGVIDVFDVSKLLWFPRSRLIAFHAWGNGDFDCIACMGSAWPQGSVVFMNHGEQRIEHVAASLSTWLTKVIGELQDKGTLLHPADYALRDEPGMYRPVARRISQDGKIV
jgi:hypothetical protein